MARPISDPNNISDKDALIADVFDSGVLGSSNHQIQLFLYLINAKHDGTINRVKAYNIAVDAFGRPKSFDGSSDSIVRVEMFRLRANLRTFNNQSDRYRLKLSKGTYNISIQDCRVDERLPEVTPTSESKNYLGMSRFKVLLAALPAIAIAGFFFIEPSAQRRNHAKCSQILPNLSVNNVGLKSDSQRYVEKIIRSAISQQTSFNVLASGQSCGENSAPVFGIDYTLAHQENSQISLAIATVSNETGKIISSQHINGSPIEAMEDEELYYELVKTANSLAMPDSILAKAAINETWPSQTKLHNYSCISLMYDSFSGGSSEELSSVHECLKASVEGGNAPLDNYGALASDYLERARHNQGPESDQMFNQASRVLQEVGNDWINSAELAIAKIYYEVQRPDFDAERLDSLLYDAETKFNTNPQVLLMVAWRYGFSLGKWDEAKIMSDRIKQMYSIRDHSVFIIDAGYALMNLEGNKLMRECERTYTENSIYINVIVNACARKANDDDWLATTEKNLRRLDALEVSDRMKVFNNTRYDFQFEGNVRKLLEAGDGT